MLRAVAFALIGACVITCSSSALSLSLSPEDEAVRDVALQWRGVVDSGNYKDAALLISEQVRGSGDGTKYFAAHRAPLGRVNNRKMANVKYASTDPARSRLQRRGHVP